MKAADLTGADVRGDSICFVFQAISAAYP